MHHLVIAWRCLALTQMPCSLLGFHVSDSLTRILRLRFSDSDSATRPEWDGPRLAVPRPFSALHLELISSESPQVLQEELAKRGLNGMALGLDFEWEPKA